MKKRQAEADEDKKPDAPSAESALSDDEKEDNADVKKALCRASALCSIINDSILQWNRNTDCVLIGFKNDSDVDADSYMYFEISDNGNEYFKWCHRQANKVTDWMKHS